ncbi:MAG: DUF4440 domain-containing protein [Acidobacteriota bacterium]|nr:MAG: DUF4440 domain-containing protein [Acidobacteriota bacterium]
MRVLCILLTLLVFSACQSADLGTGEKVVDLQADIKAINEAGQRWAEAYAAEDWEALGALFSADAIVMPPGAPSVVGRQAILDAESSSVAGIDILTAELTSDEVVVMGDLAYRRGSFTITLKLPDGTSSTDIGKFIEIWERQTDGSWLLSRDIYNSDAPPPEE